MCLPSGQKRPESSWTQNIKSALFQVKPSCFGLNADDFCLVIAAPSETSDHWFNQPITPSATFLLALSAHDFFLFSA